MYYYDKCDTFIFLVTATVASFVDILVPNRFCDEFVKNNIKRVYRLVHYNDEQSDSNSVCESVRSGESVTRDLAEGDASQSGSDGYDQASVSSGSEQKSHAD